MPKLVVFAPCERVIFGQGDNTASLIVLVQRMDFQVPTDQPLPERAGAFARLAIFSQWHRVPEDSEKVFEQKLTLGMEGEKLILEAVTEFKMLQRVNRLVGQIPILPLVKPGEYSFKLFIREKGEQVWGAPVGEYPIEIVHVKQLQPQ
jgi:hypothetical protein